MENKINLSLINVQLLLSVVNAMRSHCGNEKFADGITADDIYLRTDRDTLHGWAELCRGTDYETRVKFIPKELVKYGVIEQAADKTYSLSKDKLEVFQCKLLKVLLSQYLVIERGVYKNGLINKDDYMSYCENSDDPFFMSLRDLEKATQLYVDKGFSLAGVM